MDNFWVIPLLIFGIIVSISQKASRNTTPEGEEGEAVPTPEQEDIERRIREILEGKTTSTQKTTPTPTPSARPTPTAMATHTLKQTTPHASRQEISPRKATTTKAKTSTAKSTTKTSSTGKHTTDPIKQGDIQRGEIGRIIDDFSIEKATIYAEIMKPKYEEY